MSGIDHPWEENRGMGVSYGYNRAEDLNVYHTGGRQSNLRTERSANTCLPR